MTDATANALPTERLAGFPCWIELYTPDIDASAAFYRDLLGWEITRAEPGEPLTTEVHHDGRLIASFEPADAAPGDPGWQVSFMVDDVRTAAAAAERTGGNVVVEPTGVTATMAYALAADPDGNVVGLLEDEDCEGPYPYQAGMPVWFDVLASDLEPAERFYREVAGWSTRRLTIADQEQDFYTSVVGGRSVSGVGRAGYFGEEIPSRWRIYFGVEDADVPVRLHPGGGPVVGADVVDVEGGRQGGVLDPAQVPLQAEDHVPGHAPQGGVGGGQAPGEMTVPVDEHLALPALDTVEVVVRGDVIGRRVGVPAEGPVAGVVAARPDVRGGGHGVEVEGLLDVDLRVRVGGQGVLTAEGGGLEPDGGEHAGG